MDTLTIEVIDNKALRLISDLESLNLIKIIRSSRRESEKKLSDRLAGSISKSQADRMHDELKQMRKEWERDTY